MTHYNLSPSILSADFSNLGNSIHQVEQAGADWVHVDVMDGHFVPNITMGPFIVEACNRISKLPIDVHLMIEKPELIVKSFIDSGADYLTIHVENNPNVMRTLQFIRSLGAHPGIALNPGTPVSAIESVFPFVDLILIMTVNPGFSGQAFMPQMIEKIATVKQLSEKLKVNPEIEVDGGITAETIQLCKKAGANTFVAATAIFKHPSGIQAGVQQLRASLD